MSRMSYKRQRRRTIKSSLKLLWEVSKDRSMRLFVTRDVSLGSQLASGAA